MKRYALPLALLMSIVIIAVSFLAMWFDGVMYIEPVENVDHVEYRYKSDGKAANVALRLYRLEDCAWVSAAEEERIPCAQKKGSISFGALGLMAQQLEYQLYDGDTALAGNLSATEPVEEMKVSATDWLDGRAEFVYGEEIPLAVQALHGTNEGIRSFGASDYFNPAYLAELGCDGVYALTISFEN